MKPSPTINLEILFPVNGPNTFRVVSTKDTVKHYPGDLLGQVEVKKLVQQKAITINIRRAK